MPLSKSLGDQPFEPSMEAWLEKGQSGLLSVVIPAHNEAENLKQFVPQLIQTLEQARIEHEILVVNDSSIDETEKVLGQLQQQFPTCWYLNNSLPKGFGLAVRKGLMHFKGEWVLIVMADGSDLPKDVVRFARALQQGNDCVFGSRFMSSSRVIDYPIHKKILNRCFNNMIRCLFQFRYNDISNAFKGYRRHVIAGLHPLLAHHFNLTVELPLKAIIRGYSYTVLPNDWVNRKTGVSKLKIREMGSRYMFIVLYCLLEKWLSRGDYTLNRSNHMHKKRQWPKAG